MNNGQFFRKWSQRELESCLQSVQTCKKAALKPKSPVALMKSSSGVLLLRSDEKKSPSTSRLKGFLHSGTRLTPSNKKFKQIIPSNCRFAVSGAQRERHTPACDARLSLGRLSSRKPPSPLIRAGQYINDIGTPLFQRFVQLFFDVAKDEGLPSRDDVVVAHTWWYTILGLATLMVIQGVVPELPEQTLLVEQTIATLWAGVQVVPALPESAGRRPVAERIPGGAGQSTGRVSAAPAEVQKRGTNSRFGESNRYFRRRVSER